MADHLHSKKERKVSGHLEKRRGYWHMVLSWPTEGGTEKGKKARGRESRTTGLPIKGNKKRAEEMLAEYKREKQEELGRVRSGSSMLFADYLEYKWLPRKKMEIKLTTYGGYQNNISHIIAPYFRAKGTTLAGLTGDDINAFYEHVQATRKTKGITLQKYHANMSNALDRAVKEGLIYENVLKKYVDRPKKVKFQAKFYCESEVLELFAKLEGHILEYAALMAAFFGLRRAEVVGIMWSNIDFAANTFKVEHTVTAATVDGRRIEVADDTAKTKSSLQTYPMVPPVRKKPLLMEEEQQRNREVFGNSYNVDFSAYVYVDKMGNRIKPDYITRVFPKFLEQNGLRKIRFHDLRHTTASLLVANGVPLIKVKEWLGHSEIGITADTYD